MFKIKTNDDRIMNLKGRIFVHGNREDERNKDRSDITAADILIIRMFVRLAEIWGFTLATADIKGAYMQSGPIKRVTYVRPL